MIKHWFRSFFSGAVMALVVLTLAISACGDSRDSDGNGGGGHSSLDGLPCEGISSYACDADITHLCRFADGRQFWEAKTDCKGSTSPDCRCTLIQGLGTCSTDNTINGACEGTPVN